MEEKILNAIQHIRSKCKKRVTSQRIYSFFNKGALFLEPNSFQDFTVGLEIDGCISKRGKGKLLNLLNGVTTKRDETNLSCKSLQIKTTSEINRSE